MKFRSVLVASTATAIAVGGLLITPAVAAPVKPEVTAALDKPVFAPDEVRTLQVTENISARRTFAVSDSSGVAWTRVGGDATGATFTSPAPTQVTGGGGGDVTVTMTRVWDGATAVDAVAYQVVAPPTAKWPGHQPGKLVLGMSCPDPCGQLESELGAAYGVRRKFSQWGDWSGVAAEIDTDHRTDRLPWVSIKGPRSNAAGWRALAGGYYDAQIDSLAAMLKDHDDQPVILTFHHEPSNDATESEGRDWAAAYSHLHDRLLAQGALANVADAPIVGDWLFNPRNRSQDPANWVTKDVLSRAPFLGIDLYENGSGEAFAQRLPRILDYMESLGFGDLQVGIGEFGGTDAAYPTKSAVEWINESLQWAMENPEDIGVASYFNSTNNSKEGTYWSLSESATKLETFRSWLSDPRVN